MKDNAPSYTIYPNNLKRFHVWWEDGYGRLYEISGPMGCTGDFIAKLILAHQEVENYDPSTYFPNEA